MTNSDKGLSDEMDNPRLNWVSKNVRGKKILDIGFAELTDSGKLFHKKIREKNPESFIIPLDKSKDTFNRDFENIVQSDVYNLPFKDNSFDCVSILEVIEHLWNPKKAAAEIFRVLSPEGKLFLTTPNPYDFIRIMQFVFKAKANIGGDKMHTMLFDRGSLENILVKSGFEIISYSTVNLRIPLLRWEFSKNPFFFKNLGANLCIIAKKPGK